MTEICWLSKERKKVKQTQKFTTKLFILSKVTKLLAKANFYYSGFWNFGTLAIHTIYVILWFHFLPLLRYLCELHLIG